MIEDITQHKKGVLNFRDFLDMLHATITDTHKAIDDNNNKQKTGNAPRRKRVSNQEERNDMNEM